jgi:hypothetical protein
MGSEEAPQRSQVDGIFAWIDLVFVVGCKIGCMLV